jgi:hypothetical protein
MRKWIRGERITDFHEVIDRIMAGEVIFHHEKAQNSGWLRGWQLNCIVNDTRRGFFYRAIRNEVLK